MIEDWNIEGIANRVIEEMRENDADINDVDDYVHHTAYLSVYSRVPEDAQAVAGLVKQMVIAKYGVEENA